MSDTDLDIDPPPQGYAAAVAELDDILDAIEATDVDVDVLAAKVRRASDLIQWCRARVLAARGDVEAAAAELSGD